MRQPHARTPKARLRAGTWGLLLLAWALIAGPTAIAQEAPPTITGADGVAVEINDTSRIITLGGSITEIVYALGLGDQIVATDLSSTFPPAIMEKPRLGYFRRASAEGILSQEPSLIISTEGLGPPPVLEQLRTAGVPLLILEEATSVEAAADRIRTVAQVLEREELGEGLVQDMERDVAAARELQDDTQRPGVLFIYARGVGAVSVAGTDTGAESMIELAGGSNVVTAYEGYRPITAEAVVTAAPDVILIPARGLESIGGVDGLLEQPGIALTPAGQNRRVVAVDDALLLSFGPRLGTGVLDMTRALYDVKAPEGTQ
ncbi:MAG: hemin ABC transporter substrate-binding protein [Bacteroidota bacterium]